MSEGDPAGGTVRIPNRLIDALLLADLSKRQMLVALAVIRRTLGWREKGPVDISMRYIARATRLDPSNVSKAVRELESMRIIHRFGTDRQQQIMVEQDPDRWEGVVKTTTIRGQNDHTQQVKTTTVRGQNDHRGCGQNDLESVVVLTTKTDSTDLRSSDQQHTGNRSRSAPENSNHAAAAAEEPRSVNAIGEQNWLNNIRRLYGDRSVDYAMAKLESSSRQILDPRAYILRVAEGHQRDEAERQQRRDQPRESVVQYTRRIADEQIAAIERGEFDEYMARMHGKTLGRDG